MGFFTEDDEPYYCEVSMMGTVYQISDLAPEEPKRRFWQKKSKTPPKPKPSFGFSRALDKDRHEPTSNR